MPTVPTGSILQPGKDAHSHTQVLQQSIAQTLATLTGGPVTQTEVIPPQDHSVALEDTQPLMENPQPKIDLDDLKLGIEGKPRTEPSGNLLNIWLARLRKKHPDMEVKVKT